MMLIFYVIHTSVGYDENYIAWSYPWGHLGISEPLGHIDFYPSGGGWQPACALFWKSITDPFCAHAQSVEYFFRSFQKCNYNSVPCDSIDVMREGARSCQRGNGPGSRMGFHAHEQRGRGRQYVDINKYYYC